MKVTFDNGIEYRDFLGADFDDIAGSGTNRENRFDEGVQALSDWGDDLGLDLDQKWFESEELEDLGLIRH
jgi:hypothetical protein